MCVYFDFKEIIQLNGTAIKEWTGIDTLFYYPTYIAKNSELGSALLDSDFSSGKS